MTVTANNQSKVYGGADPTLTYTPSGTLYYGDTYSVITGVSLSTTTGAAATAGTHAITATGGTASNYAIADVNGTLTVSQASLTVTANNQSKVYGAADPTLTYTPSGTLYYGDTYSVITGVSLSTATGAAASAGIHTITASGGTAANYAIADVNGILTVSQASLTVTANNQSKVYGAADPTLTYTPSGTLYYGDTYSVITGVTLSTTTGAAATAGTHTITASGGTAANYAIADVNGILTVTQHATTTSLTSSAPTTAPGQSVTFTAAVTGGLSSPPYLAPTGTVQFQINDQNAGAPVPLNANDTATYSTSFSTAGSFTVTAVYSGDTNYKVSTGSAGTQTILAPGVYAVGSTLYVVGANTSDYAAISAAGAKNDGSTGLSVAATLNGIWSSSTFTATFTTILIAGYGGNDNFQLASTLTLPTTVTEGNGNNYIQLAGGNDSVTLGTGSNQVFGGNGNKTITDSDAAGTSAYIQLGNGNNVINMGAGNDQVVLGTGNNTVIAGNGNDSVTTSGSGNNIVTLGNGNDYVSTGNGSDVIALGSGNETILTGNGNKTITAGNGTDYVSAGSGTVLVTLGNGADNVQVGNGGDTIALGSGNDYVSGGSGNDVVTAASGADNVQLGGGNENVTLGDGNDYVSAGDGIDNVTVGNGNDNIQLGNGSDVIIEGNGNDYVSAGNGANLVVAGLGQHTVQLGNGNDILIDGSATVVNSGDSFRQILSDWNSSSSTSVDTQFKVVYNTSHPSVLKAGSGRDWWFYTYAKDVTNKKSSDRLN